MRTGFSPVKVTAGLVGAVGCGVLPKVVGSRENARRGIGHMGIDNDAQQFSSKERKKEKGKKRSDRALVASVLCFR